MSIVRRLLISRCRRRIVLASCFREISAAVPLLSWDESQIDPFTSPSDDLLPFFSEPSRLRSSLPSRRWLCVRDQEISFSLFSKMSQTPSLRFITGISTFSPRD